MPIQMMWWLNMIDRKFKTGQPVTGVWRNGGEVVN
jgi:hypothetical protein